MHIHLKLLQPACSGCFYDVSDFTSVIYVICCGLPCLGLSCKHNKYREGALSPPQFSASYMHVKGQSAPRKELYYQL